MKIMLEAHCDEIGLMISKISDDVLDGKLDVQNNISQENENPLKVGETQNFPAILEEQMYIGMNKAAMFFDM